MSNRNLRPAHKHNRNDILDVVGYIMFPNIDTCEYRHYVARRIRYCEIESGLSLGVYPPGLIFNSPAGLEMVDRARRNLLKINFGID